VQFFLHNVLQARALPIIGIIIAQLDTQAWKLKERNLQYPLDAKAKKRAPETNLQWNRCLANVSLGINSETSNLSSPSQQQPSKFANLWFLS